MSTKYKHSHEVPTDVLAERLSELSDAVGKRGADRDRELTRRVPAELDRDADLVLSEAAQRLVKLEAERDAYRAAEEHQIARRQKMEEERDALAAHAEMLQEIADEVFLDLMDDPSPTCHVIFQKAVQPPAASLDRRDARIVADALLNLLGVVRCSGNHYLIATIETNIEHLRQQAEVHQ